MGEALIPDGEDMYYGGKDKDGSFSKLDLKKLAAETVEEALSGIGAKSVPSGKYHIVFTGEAFAQLLTTFDSVFSAEMAQKGMSLLSGREGERIAAECVTLIDDPMHPENPVRRTFDAEGVAAHKKNVVEDGTLKTLLHNLSTAAKAGVSSTGNGQKMTYSSAVSVGPFTFYLKPCQGTGQELIAEAKTGLCIKEVSGLHAGANPITGDFSLLAAGYRFEGGKRTFPVKNTTVSGNFYTLLKEIDRVGDDLKFIRTRGGKCGSPSVLVRDMSVAGEG
jgi:PmbA protein